MTQQVTNRLALRAFLEHPDRPTGTLGYHQAQGFLFAIVNAPEPIPPSEWMPIVFNEQEPGYSSMEQATAVIGDLIDLYNEASAAVVGDHAVLPADCQFRDPTIANLEDDSAPVAEWCRGFIVGHRWLEESWEAYTPEEIDDELGAMVMTQSLEAMAETIRRVFPLAMGEYATLGQTIQRLVVKADQEPARSTKIGRNEPCPCGSGKKYKKCCGAGAS